jgi:hypothetical protein
MMSEPVTGGLDHGQGLLKQTRNFGKPKDLPIIEEDTGVSMGYHSLNVTYQLKLKDSGT